MHTEIVYRNHKSVIGKGQKAQPDNYKAIIVSFPYALPKFLNKFDIFGI